MVKPEKFGHLHLLCHFTVPLSKEKVTDKIIYLIKEPKIKSINPLIFIFSFSLQNLPQQSVNAEAFAEAYPCFLVSASAKKMRRQLSS